MPLEFKPLLKDWGWSVTNPSPSHPHTRQGLLHMAALLLPYRPFQIRNHLAPPRLRC